ncbi:SDR family oxidoreductase [Deinococcus radiomollis]|uniref:SDR family NAD(P)-dependent oxidoreductase n=1 Tax=Deinococcus radiomollis TaxID=468916 RepID=UPI0038929098
MTQPEPVRSSSDRPGPVPRPTALVTGASGGIGEALAVQLAGRGVNLILVARTESKLQALAETLRRQHGVRADVVALDLADKTAPQQLHEAVDALGLQADFLINNAGFASFGEFHALPLAEQLDMLQVNIVTLTELTHRFLPGMVSRGRGRVLNVASTAAFMPGPLMAVYYASKAYVLSFSEALDEELRGTGVSVTALCPGPVETGFQARAQMEDSRLLSSAVNRVTMLSVEEVAKQGLDAMFRGRSAHVAGLGNRLLTWMPRFMPRRLVPGMIRRAQERR